MMTGSHSPTLFLLFNHALTADQEADARSSLGIDRIVPAPQAIQVIWSNVPPDLEELTEYLKPVYTWLADTAEPNDFILVQGDFGATCLIADFTQAQGLQPVYSTTVREAAEDHLPDGSVLTVHRFKHRMFRHYKR